MNVYKRQIILLFAGLFSLLVFLYCLLVYYDVRNQYHLISVLPLIYGIVSLFLFLSPNISFLKILCVLCYAVKMVIIPLFVFLSGDELLYRSANPRLSDYIPEAVVLQCFEIVSVAIFLLLYKDRKELKVQGQKYVYSFFNRRADFWIKILFLVAICLLILFPQFLYEFQPIVFSEQSQFVLWTQLANTVKDSMPIYVYYIGGWIISVSKLLLPFYFIVKISKGKQIKDWFKIVLSFIIVILSCSFTSAARASTIFTAIMSTVLLQRIYVRQSEIILRLLVTVVGLGVVLFFISGLTVDSSNFADTILSKLNAYFAGIFNMSAVFLMDTSDKLEYLLGDLLRSIPLIRGFFTSLPMSYLEFNTALALDTEYNSQILPALGQGYYYIGYLGVIFPLLMLRVSFLLYDKMLQTNDSFTFFALGMTFIYVFGGIYLYDAFLTLSLILHNCLPMLVIMKISQYKIKI